MDLTASEYPCWLYSAVQPLHSIQCPDASAWYRYRRKKWKRIAPDKTSTRLIKLLDSMGISTDVLVKFMDDAGFGAYQDIVRRIAVYNAPPSAYSPDVLDAIATSLAVPVTYLYMENINSIPNIFRARYAVTKHSMFKPAAEEKEAELSDAVFTGVLSVPSAGPALRVFHVLYTVDGVGGYRRAHVITSDAKRAADVLLSQIPDASVVETSSQALIDGLIVYGS